MRVRVGLACLLGRPAIAQRLLPNPKTSEEEEGAPAAMGRLSAFAR